MSFVKGKKLSGREKASGPGKKPSRFRFVTKTNGYSANPNNAVEYAWIFQLPCKRVLYFAFI